MSDDVLYSPVLCAGEARVDRQDLAEAACPGAVVSPGQVHARQRHHRQSSQPEPRGRRRDR